MKKEVADIWVASLRSGKYIQGKGKLNCDGKFCCLGVLCELALEQGATVRKYMYDEYTPISYDDTETFPPLSVTNWAGLNNRYGEGKDFSLADLNDKGTSFNEIADIIEKKYEEL